MANMIDLCSSPTAVPVDAAGPDPGLQTLLGMGFSAVAARSALRSTHGSVANAIALLLQPSTAGGAGDGNGDNGDDGDGDGDALSQRPPQPGAVGPVAASVPSESDLRARVGVCETARVLASASRCLLACRTTAFCDSCMRWCDGSTLQTQLSNAPPRTNLVPWFVHTTRLTQAGVDSILSRLGAADLESISTKVRAGPMTLHTPLMQRALPPLHSRPLMLRTVGDV